MRRPDHPDAAPLLAACLTVGLLFGGLLVGVEPVGGDPDRIFRPIKAELARSLRGGTLPSWSDRFGLGVPLVAESHVAAFYPPNWALYGLLDVSTAYRVSMWLHVVALAAGTYAYARALGIRPWGAAVSGVSFPLCGFLTVHASHEWSYGALAYLPLVLLAAHRYAETGRARWLAATAGLWGVQIAVGHFQVQMWTGGLALVTGAWRVVADRRPTRRLVGLAIGLGWGLAVAAVQLVPTWELARLVGQTSRSFADLAYYAYPPGHWAEAVVPGLFRRLVEGPEAPYWFTQGTTGFESCLFAGTVPLILAGVGLFGGGRGLTPWRWVVPASLALATMPHWWPRGFAAVLAVPGLGYFRCPSRYTAVASFGLALLAGGGLDRAIGSGRFRLGLAGSIALGVGGMAWAVGWTLGHPRLLGSVGGDIGLAYRVGLAAISWGIGLGAVVGWRRGGNERAAAILVLTAVEMGAFYYVGGTTTWGRAVPLPASSPILSRLAAESGVGRVGGVLDNLPVRAGLPTATPYTGFPLPPPHPLLKASQDPRSLDDPAAVRWLRRFGVSHLVRDDPAADRLGEVVIRLPDPALDRLVYRRPGQPDRRDWRVVRLPEVFPEARVALRSVVAPDLASLVGALSRRDAADEAWHLPADAPPAPRTPSARSARVVRWDGLAGEVEHDGACELVLTRAHYPGWVARVDDGPEAPVTRADGGLIAVPIDGSGTSRVTIRYRPTGLPFAASVSTIAVVLVFASLFIRTRKSSAVVDPNPMIAE